MVEKLMESRRSATLQKQNKILKVHLIKSMLDLLNLPRDCSNSQRSHCA